MEKYLTFDIETTGLNPLIDRITCIGAKFDIDETKHAFSTSTKEDEKEMLKEFWDYIEKNKIDYLVGWNINGFDWKFLKIRSLILGVKISKYFTRKERLDLMFILAMGKWEKLDNWAQALFKKKKDMANPIDLWRLKKIDELTAYNKKDVELTHDIFKRCVECGIIEIRNKKNNHLDNLNNLSFDKKEL